MSRKAYPSAPWGHPSDEEWAFIAPYLTLMREDAPQREHPLREVFNGARWMVRAGASWRMMPHDLPPCGSPVGAVYQQMQRWIKAGVFEAMVHDLRVLLRVAAGREEQPSAAILSQREPRRTIQSTPESGDRAGYDGGKRKKGSKVHMAVDTLGNLLALHVTAANEQERYQVYELAEQVQEVTGDAVQVAFVDQGYTGDIAQQMAADHGIELIVVKLEQAQKGFVLLPKRWVVERSFAWTGRFRRLARDYERLPQTLAGLHCLAFAILMLKNVIQLFSSSA